MMHERLFISHASADAAVVERIAGYLEARGVACWLAHRDIPPRSIYAEAITQALRACNACAVVVSRTANESDAVKRELELASHYRKPFIPIRIDGTELGPGLDHYLRNSQWVDYAREGERALDRIVSHQANGSVDRPRSSHTATGTHALEIKRAPAFWACSSPLQIIWNGARLASLSIWQTKRFHDLGTGSLQFGFSPGFPRRDQLSHPIRITPHADALRIKVRVNLGLSGWSMLLWFDDDQEPTKATFDEIAAKIKHFPTVAEQHISGGSRTAR